MNLKFFSSKNTASNAEGTIVQLYINKISPYVEVNGSGKELLKWLSRLHKDDLKKMQDGIDEILSNEKPLQELVKEVEARLMREIKEKKAKETIREALKNAINERSKDRCEAIQKKLNEKLTEHFGKSFKCNFEPKLSENEIEARFLIEEKYEKQSMSLIRRLQTEKFELKTKLAQTEKSNSLDMMEKKPKISLQEMVREYKRVTTALKNKHAELNQRNIQLEKFEKEIARLVNKIKEIDQQILKANKEESSEMNIKRLEELNAERKEKEKLIDVQREKEKVFKEEIAALELEIIKYHAEDLFLPWFSFLRKHFSLSPAFQYQLAKKLIADSKNKNSNLLLWQNNLFPFLAALEKSENPQTVMTDWLKINSPHLNYQIERLHKINRFVLSKEELPDAVSEYFNNLDHHSFSLNTNTVLYLLPSFLGLETKDIEKTLLLPEINQRVTDPEAFWKECWQIGYHETDTKIKFEKLQELWKKYQLNYTQIALWGDEKLALVNPAPTPHKIMDALTQQNILKKNFNRDSIHLLKRHYGSFKNLHRSIHDRHSKRPVYIAFGLQISLLAGFSFYFLNSFIYLVTPFIPGLNLLTLTALVSVPIFSLLSYASARWYGLVNMTLRQIYKTTLNWRTERKKDRLLTEVLKLSNKSFADFELELWQEFLNNYADGAALTKKIAHEWLSQSKKKMRLTNKMENNELDRWVENVIVGEMGFDKNKVFSQSDFDQIRSLLVSELIDRYLKKTLSEQTQKIVGSLPEKKFEKFQLKKELKFLLKKIKQNPKEPYVESAVYQHKFFDEDSLSWLSIYQNHASLKGKNRSKSLIVSGLVSVLLLITAAFKPVNSQKKMEPVETSGKNILSMPHDIFDIRSQIKMQWPIHGDEIYIKAHGNSDTKVLVDPALFAAVLEVEKITDSDLPNQNLYEKVNFLRQLISNPQYSKNLFYILARYYIEKYDRQSLPWLSQWQLNKSFTPNLFLKQSDGLPYEDTNFYGVEKKYGWIAEAYIPEKTVVYDFVKKVIARYKKYRERPEHFQSYEWIKQKFISDFLNPYRIAPAHRAALEVRSNQTSPEGIYAELYRKLVLLGAIPHADEPSQKKQLRAVLNSSYVNRDLDSFKAALNEGGFDKILSVDKAQELIARCNEALAQWKKTQDFFEQLKEMIPELSQKILKTTFDRDEFMEIFIKKFNEKALWMKRPSFHAQLGLPEKHSLDDHLYDIFQQKFEKYLHSAPLNGPITSPFKEGRYHPKLGKTYIHGATDIGAEHGTPIKPIWNGKANVFLNDPSYGNYIVITTTQADGVVDEVTYAHCSKILVPNGADVTHGEVVALVGSTGYSSGSHLHIAVKRNGVPQPYDHKFLEAMKMSVFDRLVQFLSKD